MRSVWLFCLAVIVASCSLSPLESPLPATPSPSITEEIKEEPAVISEDEPVTTSELTPSPGEATPDAAAMEASLDHADLLNQLLFSISTRTEGQAILEQITESRDIRFVAGLIDTMRYQSGLQQEIGATLNALTGQDLAPDWFEWVEWAGKHPEIENFAEYTAWKANLFAQIDPNFLRFIYPGVKIDPDSRLEEVEWGGVLVDGIPALDNPKMVAPSEADYLVPEERVFGVSINGDTRAYPARFLDWHEMFNDIVGGEPVSLAY